MWLKGNLHAHTTNSDGEASPDEACEWYAGRGYDFLAISDHWTFTDPSSVRDHGLVLIPAIELHTGTLESPNRQVHVNAFGISQSLTAEPAATTADTLQGLVDLIRGAGGVPQINHPNFEWAFDHRDMLPVRNWSLLEVYNGHPDVHNLGDENRPSVEWMWDELLAAGHRIFAVAVDDAHHYFHSAPYLANPGRGWVFVDAEDRSAAAILSSLESGLFYASTGPCLRAFDLQGDTITAEVEPEAGLTYAWELIGGPGLQIARTHGKAAVFQLPSAKETRGYVRVKLSAGDGSAAWLQPVRLPSCSR